LRRGSRLRACRVFGFVIFVTSLQVSRVAVTIHTPVKTGFTPGGCLGHSQTQSELDVEIARLERPNRGHPANHSMRPKLVERGEAAMTQTEALPTATPYASWGHAPLGPRVLIRVPRVAVEPIESGDRWRGWRHDSDPSALRWLHAEGRPIRRRRRLRRGVRVAGLALVAVLSLAAGIGVAGSAWSRGGDGAPGPLLSVASSAKTRSKWMSSESRPPATPGIPRSAEGLVDTPLRPGTARSRRLPPPVVVLSIEESSTSNASPSASASSPPPPVAEARAPVVFPGYLLPDDAQEDPSHEGS
jgi:hypothetical protein